MERVYKAPADPGRLLSSKSDPTFHLLINNKASRTKKGMTALSIPDVLERATAVCFDVDSTLIREEGIDRLAEACGVGEEVEKM